MKKFLIKVFVYSALFMCVNFLFGQLLKLYRTHLIEAKKFNPPIKWEEFYTTEAQTIDIVFIGSSHCIRSFNPSIFDEITSLYSYNLGTPGQSSTTSYFVLKEVLRFHKPKIVIQEISYRGFSAKNQLVNGSYNFDFMKMSRNKLDFFFNGFKFSESLTFLFPSFRFRNNLGYVINYLYTGKKAEKAKEDTYKGKGFISRNHSVTLNELKNNNIYEKKPFNAARLNKKHLKYLEKTVGLCKKNKIQIIWVTAPLPKITISKIRHSSKIYPFFKNLADQYRVPYLNYYADEKIKFIDTSDFQDTHHLNRNGAKKLSTDLAKRILEYLNN